MPGGTGVSPDGKSVDDSAVEKAFAEAEVVISQRMMNHRLVPNAIEPRGVVAHYEPGKDLLTIWSSTQNPHILRTMVAGMHDLGEHQIRAIAPEVGGGFGAKINIYAEEYVCSATFETARDSAEVDRGAFGSIRGDHARARHHLLPRHRGKARRHGARPQDAADRRHRRLQHAAHRRHPDADDADGERHLRHPGNSRRRSPRCSRTRRRPTPIAARAGRRPRTSSNAGSTCLRAS